MRRFGTEYSTVRWKGKDKRGEKQQPDLSHTYTVYWRDPVGWKMARKLVKRPSERAVDNMDQMAILFAISRRPVDHIRIGPPHLG